MQLAEADRHVADAERRVAVQESRVEQLRWRLQDTTQAERLLSSLEDLLHQFRAHRKALARSRRGSG